MYSLSLFDEYAPICNKLSEEAAEFIFPQATFIYFSNK